MICPLLGGKLVVLLEAEAIGVKVDDDLQRSKAGKKKDPDFRLQKGKEEAEQNDRKEKAGKVSKQRCRARTLQSRALKELEKTSYE
jgi:hypothetical protein